MIAKKHKSNEGKIILAVCDSHLTGKKIIEGDFQLDLTCDFYKGEEKSEQEIIEMIKEADIVNAVGEGAVSLLKKIKLIEKSSRIFSVMGVPHAEVVIERE